MIPIKGVRSLYLASRKECVFAISSRQERLLTPFSETAPDPFLVWRQLR
jgi:hypothetical protein